MLIKLQIKSSYKVQLINDFKIQILKMFYYIIYSE